MLATHLKKLTIVAAALVALYLIVSWLAVPVAVRRYAASWAEAELGAQVEVEAVTWNPLTLSLEARGLVASGGDQTSSLRFERVTADLELRSLLEGAVVLRSIQLEGPALALVIDESGRLRLMASRSGEILAEAKTDGERTESGVGIVVEEIEVRGGRVSITDRSRPELLELDLDPIDLRVRDIRYGVGETGGSALDLRLGLLEGGYALLTGEVDLDSLALSLDVNASNLDLTTLQPLLSPHTRARLQSGVLDLELGVEYAGDANPPLRIAGRFTLEDLAVGQGASDPETLRVEQIEVTDVEVALDPPSLSIGSVTLQSPVFQLVREPDGSNNLARVFAGVESLERVDVEESDAPAGPRTRLEIAEIVVSGGRLSVSDRSIAQPLDFDIDPISLTARSVLYGARQGGRTSFELRLGLPGDGRATLSGDADLDAPALSLDLKADDLDLTTLQPLVSEQLRAELRSGLADLELSLEYARLEAPSAKLVGRATVRELAVGEPAADQEVIRIERIDIEGIDAELEPLALAVDSISLASPYVHLVRDPDGSSNLARLVARARSEERATTTASGETPGKARAAGPALRVAAITLGEGSLFAEDRGIEPVFEARIDALEGAVRDVSLEPDARIAMELRGQTGPSAPVAVSLLAVPFAPVPSFSLEIDSRRLSLGLFSPYAGRYAGFGIAGGHSDLELAYALEGTRLRGENQIVIDRIAFGERVPSSDATKVPVRLATRLMQDGKGRIDFDLEVEGDVSEPGFNLPRILWGEALELMTGVVRRPLGVLGSTFARLMPDDQIEFSPGLSTVDTLQSRTLDELARALRERPQLRVTLEGRSQPRVDGPALAGHSKEGGGGGSGAGAGTPDEAALGALALQRAESVRRYLTEVAELDAERVEVLDPAAPSDSHRPSVFVSLDTSLPAQP